jgi:hypothetical protein
MKFASRTSCLSTFPHQHESFRRVWFLAKFSHVEQHGSSIAVPPFFTFRMQKTMKKAPSSVHAFSLAALRLARAQTMSQTSGRLAKGGPWAIQTPLSDRFVAMPLGVFEESVWGGRGALVSKPFRNFPSLGPQACRTA